MERSDTITLGILAHFSHFRHSLLGAHWTGIEHSPWALDAFLDSF